MVITQEEDIEIDFSEYPPGIYIVEIGTEEGIVRRKIVK